LAPDGRRGETPCRLIGSGRPSAPLAQLFRVLGYNDEPIDELFEEGVTYKEEALDRLDQEFRRLDLAPRTNSGPA